MSLIFATQLTAVATAALAVFAIVTAYYARKALRSQSKEVSDQATMLKVQSEQLDEQRKMNAEQIKVLELQAKELRESIDEHGREREQRHRSQASPAPSGHRAPAPGHRGRDGLALGRRDRRLRAAVVRRAPAGTAPRHPSRPHLPAASGVDVRIVSDRVGHSGSKMTRDYLRWPLRCPGRPRRRSSARSRGA